MYTYLNIYICCIHLLSATMMATALCLIFAMQCIRLQLSNHFYFFIRYRYMKIYLYFTFFISVFLILCQASGVETSVTKVEESVDNFTTVASLGDSDCLSQFCALYLSSLTACAMTFCIVFRKLNGMFNSQYFDASVFVLSWKL